MLIINDLVGDENDSYLCSKYLGVYIQTEICKALEISANDENYRMLTVPSVIDKPIRSISFTTEIKV